jgi:hypothetical protein
VLQHHQTRLVATLKSCPNISSTGRAFRRLVFDTFSIENSRIEINSTGFVTGGINGIDLNQFLQPDDGFIFDGLS